MATETPSWERFKENAAPLQRGRNVDTLDRACGVETDEDRDAKESCLRTFENLVSPSEDMQGTGEQLSDNDDPLIHWMSYIKFHQDYFPSDKPAQFLLMERCVRALVDQHKYANDARFIRICAMYADQTEDPGEIFKYLHSKKIGGMTALFWIAWAFWEEKQENFPKVEKIFKKGLSKKAKPLNMLEQRHKQFERRMARRWMNQNQGNEDGIGAEDEENRGNRGVLGSLSEEAFRRNDRSSARNQHRSRYNQLQRGHNNLPPANMATFIDRSAQSQHQSRRPTSSLLNRNHGPKSNSNATASTGFMIFQDGQENDGYNLDQPTYTSAHRRLAREEDRRKENALAAEKWNQRGGLHTTSHHHHHHRSNAGSAVASTRPPPIKKSQPFAVFVDEECAVEYQRKELQQQADEDRRRRHRDERTFRPLEAGDSVAEKLYQDPLRYVKDPSQRSSDEQAWVIHSDENHQANHCPTKEKERDQRNQDSNKNKGSGKAGFDKSLLAKDSKGQEQCFNEQRAFRQHFTLVSEATNFNDLKKSVVNESTTGAKTTDDSTMDIDENTTTGDLSMEEGTNHDASFQKRQAENKEPPPSQQKQPGASHTVHLNGNTSFEARDRSINVSQCSSTVNEAHAVGIHDPEEETINTKLAMREMSMMFCSPATAAFVNNSSSRKAKRSKTEPEELLPGFAQTSFESDKGGEKHASDSDSEESDTADFAAVMDLVGSCNLNATSSLPSPLQPDKSEVENQGPKNPLSRSASPQEFIDEHALKPLHDDPSHSTGCRSGPRRVFGAIAQDNPLQGVPVNPLQDDPGFSIYSDSNNGDNDKNERTQAKKQPAKRQPFAIHMDDPATAANNQLGTTFTILEESSETSPSSQEKKQPSDAGFTLFEDSKPSPIKQRRSPPAGFMIFQDTPKPSPPEKEATASQSKAQFPIFMDVSNESSKSSARSSPVDGDGGDTATSSLFGGLVSAFGDDGRSSNGKSTSNTDRRGTIITEGFGDLSMISVNDVSVAPNRILDASPTIELNLLKQLPDAVDYNKTYKANLKSAIRRMKEAASGKIEQNATLIQLLAAKKVYDVSKQHVLPRIFKRKLLDKGSEIRIGNIGGRVKRELGRGAYGVVVLLDMDEKDDSSNAIMAVKAVSSGESLAHEFDILKKIEDRIGPQYKHKQKHQDSHPFPYPKPISYVALADGGLMSMTAGSESGLNLVDLVNAYQEKNWRVDDLIALHYMARMLHHLEELHWHGRIVHCDVKPDNWVLSNNGSDLMLVDYGRSVDLSELAAASSSNDAMDMKLLGEASEQDMMCVAMRKGRPWSFDTDTFGVCASAHVLLWGTHIEIYQSRSKRWMPRQSLKRYWQRDLWTELFDTLLNSDEGTTIGSRPGALQLLRKKVEARLDGQRPKLNDLFRKQQTILWSTRPAMQPNKRKR